MMKKLIIGIVLAVFVSSCFAGYSSGGGRSGYSGGSRGYSSSRSYSSHSRSGYSRSSRAYVAPRTYSRSYSGSNTVVHNNHYSHGSVWGFGGNSFFHGFLGGYLGGSMANHNTTVVAGGQVMPQGQGMLMESGYVQPSYGIMSSLISFMLFCLLAVLLAWACLKFYRTVYDDSRRW